MDDINKLAGRHFNYHCKGGFSCTCPGCAGPTRTRIADMVSRVDRSSDTENRSSSRCPSTARRARRIKRLLTRRAKRKVALFVSRETARGED